MRQAFAVICILTAMGLNVSRADSGWYVVLGAGLSGGEDIAQEGWNQDTFCYPDSACFDQDPVPRQPGYRWQYDNALERGAAFELALGREFGRARLELSIAQQTNDIDQAFESIAYFDGRRVEPRAGAPVVSDGGGTIKHQRVRSVSLDAFYDLPVAWGALTPWIGAGIGMADTEIGSVRFAIDYRRAAGTPGTYDPPLAFYSSLQDEDLGDQALIWHLHAGIDYELTQKTSLGLKFTWSAAEDIEDTGGYETHPMHQTDLEFTNTNSFSGANNYRLMLALRHQFGS